MLDNKIKVLVVDDESELRKSLISTMTHSLSNLNFQFIEASNGMEAVEKVKFHSFDLVLMDVRMPEMTGLEALKLIKQHSPGTFVVIITAHSNLPDAVEAIKNGAYDYIEKPINSDKLASIIEKALTARNLVSSMSLSSPVFDDDLDTEFVGYSKKMREVFSLVDKLCQVDTTVLIRGENGTGKELVAKAIHYNSHRKHADFVALNCGAIPENLIESELFGHEKGSFTGAIERKIGKFQMANKGTLFLDEIAEMRTDMQVKLLRIIQEKSFMPIGSAREIKTNTRIIAATNQNLEKMLEDGTFREDLYYRLNVMPIFLPPLRERIDDVDGLVAYFIKKFSAKFDNKIIGVEDNVIKALKNYTWPGNIRELENIIERAFIVEKGSKISLSSIPENVRKGAHKEPGAFVLQQEYDGPMDFDRFKSQTEKEFIINALKANRGRINKTVAHANIPKNTLLRKIKKYEINVKEYH